MIKVSFFKLFVVFTALSGCFSVLFGAWLSHASQYLIEADITRLNTAHHYQIIHTLALLVIVVRSSVQESKGLTVTALLFIFGILCFSGSLYLKTYTGIAAFGKIAPLGGILLALGWLSLVFLGKKKS